MAVTALESPDRPRPAQSVPTAERVECGKGASARAAVFVAEPAEMRDSVQRACASLDDARLRGVALERLMTAQTGVVLDVFGQHGEQMKNDVHAGRLRPIPTDASVPSRDESH